MGDIYSAALSSPQADFRRDGMLYCTSEVQGFLFEAKLLKEHRHASVKRDLQLLAQRLDAVQDAARVLPLIRFHQTDQQMLGSHTLLHTFRVNLCAGLAEAVPHVHTLNLVHKMIDPKTYFSCRTVRNASQNRSY
jgi:hypothetical protein